MKRSRVPVEVNEHAHTARHAGLRYVSDLSPGIRRLGAKDRFRYEDARGRPVRDRSILERIRALAIPPAWTDVWICPAARGHIQATGRDARGRKQYRYHKEWHEARGDTKYARMIPFACALPKIRRQVDRDMGRQSLTREKVLATVVRLLETTLVRVGNDEYARANGSYGLTTMRDHHVDIAGARLTFAFKGKSAQSHRVQITDRRLARIVRACQDLPGQELFQYVDPDGEPHGVSSNDVNEYLRDKMGDEFTAKDFRTWAGTVRALLALRSLETPETVTASRRALSGVIRQVAAGLGNTPAICRKSYVHPAVIERWQKGALSKDLAAVTARGPKELEPEERLTLAFLQRAAAAAKRTSTLEKALERSVARVKRAS